MCHQNTGDGPLFTYVETLFKKNIIYYVEFMIHLMYTTVQKFGIT